MKEQPPRRRLGPVLLGLPAKYFFLVLLSLFITWSDCTATSWTVAKDGSGDYAIIQDALDVCAPGDTVLIRPGRYDDFRFYHYPSGTPSFVIMVPKVAPLTIVGAGRDSVFIGPEEQTNIVEGYNTLVMGDDFGTQGRVEIFGVTMENAWSNARIFWSCAFHDCRFGPAYEEALTPRWADSLIIEDCVFDGGPSRSRGGIWATMTGTASSLRISHCVFRNLGTAITASGAKDFEFDDLEFEGVASAFAIIAGSEGTIRNARIGEYVAGIARIYVTTASVLTMENVTVGPGGGAAIAVDDQRTKLVGSHLRLAGGSYATLDLILGASVTLRDCSILNAGGKTIMARNAPKYGGLVDVRQCYWGTADSLQIEDWIYDGKDDANYDTVLFWPVRESPVPAKSESTGGLKALFRR